MNIFSLCWLTRFFPPIALALWATSSLAAPCPDKVSAADGPPCVQSKANPSSADMDVRLEAISHAVNDFALLPQAGDAILSVSNRNKPKAEWTKSAIWCESILQDVIALKNLEPAGDIGNQGPMWGEGGGYVKRSDSVDPDFSVKYVSGRKVVSGYVNAVWKKEFLVTIRVNGACVGSGDVYRLCTGAVHSSVWVYGPDPVHRCEATAIARLAWPSWMHTDTIIHLTPQEPRLADRSVANWLPLGKAEDGINTMPVLFDYSSLSLKGADTQVTLRLDYAKPQVVSGLGKTYMSELVTAGIDCSTRNIEPISRELIFDDGSHAGATVLKGAFTERNDEAQGVFIKSLCFLQQNGFDAPDIAAKDQWDPMVSPMAGTRIAEAKTRRQYKNGYLLVKQRNDFSTARDVKGMPVRLAVFLSAFDCHKQTMNLILGVVYGSNEEAVGTLLFDPKDNAPRLPENRKRFIDACTAMEEKN